ncbi:MAG: type II toxin-antitoxin system RelE/ParE family toxin [Eubacteriales bacterium]
MKEYKVFIEDSAEKDLFGILLYISKTLKQPTIAKRIYTEIKKQISNLRSKPARQKIVEEAPYAAQGVRKLYVENYMVFYVVDDSKKEVHVFRILYNRREWQNLLFN